MACGAAGVGLCSVTITRQIGRGLLGRLLPWVGVVFAVASAVYLIGVAISPADRLPDLHNHCGPRAVGVLALAFVCQGLALLCWPDRSRRAAVLMIGLPIVLGLFMVPPPVGVLKSAVIVQKLTVFTALGGIFMLSWMVRQPERISQPEREPLCHTS